MAWAYLRVSKESQEPENQKAQITKFADATNYWIPEDRWYVEDGISGKVPALERSAFKRLHDDLSAMNAKHNGGMPKNILMYEVSRIGRTFWESLEAIKFLEDLSPLISTSPKESFLQVKDKLMRNFMLSILIFMAEREREYLIQRTKEGVARSKTEGKHGGNQHLGYYQWSHENNCKNQDHGFGSEEKNRNFCPLRGKEFTDELGRRAIGLYKSNPKIKAVDVYKALETLLPGESRDQKYKAAWNLLNNIREMGLLEPPLASPTST